MLRRTYQKIELMKLHEREKIREKELKIVLDEIELYPHTKILEVGCGSGFQASILGKTSEFVVPTDVTKRRLRTNVKNFVKCSGENLPFKRNTFDLVFMSQVLEHIKDRHKALEEVKRVLNNRNGILVTIVPTPFWKILSVLAYYFGLFYLYLPRFIFVNSKRNTSQKYSDSASHSDCLENQGLLEKLNTYILPRLHGKYQNHWEEFMAYEKQAWAHLMESSGFKVLRTEHLFTETPKCFIMIPYFSSKKLNLSSSLAIFSTNRRGHQ